MSWINYEKDNNLVAKPFLKSTKSGGKGFFERGDKPFSVLLGGDLCKNCPTKYPIEPLDTLWNYNKANFIRKVYLPLEVTTKYSDLTSGGESYAQYGNLRPKQYPPYHQPRARMYYD